jgi:hypothetical protein
VSLACKRLLPSSGPRRYAAVVAIAAVCVTLATATPALASSRASQKSTLLSLAVKAQNNSLRYLHKTWFPQGYHAYSTAAVSSLPIGSVTETTGVLEVLDPWHGYSVAGQEDPLAAGGRFFTSSGGTVGTTRRQASATYATALALGDGTFDATRVGISRQEALRRTVAWTNGMAISHARKDWGCRWQTALWTYYLGAGSRQIWSSLPTATQELVTLAVSTEATRLAQTPPPFYRSTSGKVISRGDSKSEENAWNAALLFLAAREYASDPIQAEAWEKQARLYMITSYATPSQVGRDPRIKGSNLNPDGTVTNHGHINPDYMASYGEMLIKYQLVAADCNSRAPAEGSNNFSRVWRGFTRLSFSPKKYRKPGGTIFRKSHGQPTSNVYYPEGADWSKTRRFGFAETSVEMWARGGVDAESYGFARAHLLYTLKQQARHSDGRVFSAGETRFTEEEQFAAASFSEMVARLRRAR